MLAAVKLPVRRRTAALALALVLVMVTGRASAERFDSPHLASALPPARLPAPFILPELAHPRLDVHVEGFIGRLAPSQGAPTGAVATLTRASVEGSVLVPRRLFLGLTYPFAVALPPDGGLAPGEAAIPSGTRTLLGNTELHIRSVFPLPTGLEIGFILSVVAPTATFGRDHRPDRSAALAASSFDPTNAVHFLPGRVALRPAGDIRVLRGPFVFQGRHGIDFLIDDDGIERAKVAGRLLGHVGFLARSDLEISVEASQVYFFASDDKVTGSGPATAFAEEYRIRDGHRTSVTLGPGLRYSTPEVDVGAAFVTNVTEALSPVTSSFFAFHLSVIAHVGSAR
jgi:hypothetical protein